MSVRVVPLLSRWQDRAGSDPPCWVDLVRKDKERAALPGVPLGSSRYEERGVAQGVSVLRNLPLQTGLFFLVRIQFNLVLAPRPALPAATPGRFFTATSEGGIKKSEKIRF